MIDVNWPVFNRALYASDPKGLHEGIAAAMTKTSKLYEQLLANPNVVISFRQLQSLFAAFGFVERGGKGSHKNYKHPVVPSILTAQPARQGCGALSGEAPSCGD